MKQYYRNKQVRSIVVCTGPMSYRDLTIKGTRVYIIVT